MQELRLLARSLHQRIEKFDAVTILPRRAPLDVRLQMPLEHHPPWRQGFQHRIPAPQRRLQLHIDGEIAAPPARVLPLLLPHLLFVGLQQHDHVGKADLPAQQSCPGGLHCRQPRSTRAVARLPQAPGVMNLQRVGVEARGAVGLLQCQACQPALGVAGAPVLAHRRVVTGWCRADELGHHGGGVLRCAGGLAGGADAFDDDQHGSIFRGMGRERQLRQGMGAPRRFALG